MLKEQIRQRVSKSTGSNFSQDQQKKGWTKCSLFTKVKVHQDLPLQLGESDTLYDFMIEVSLPLIMERRPGKTMSSVFFPWTSKVLHPTLGYEYRLHAFRRVLCRRGSPTSSLRASPTGDQRHRPSDVVEAVSARVSRLGPND